MQNMHRLFHVADALLEATYVFWKGIRKREVFQKPACQKMRFKKHRDVITVTGYPDFFLNVTCACDE